MILPGSYANGFAPRDGRPIYPSLWRGCVGAWSPRLGPTGLALMDWSGSKNHGVLTNMDASSDWVASQGRYALDFDGSNDYVVCGSSLAFATGSQLSVSGWFNTRSVATYQGLAGRYSPGSGYLVGVYVSKLFIQINSTYTTNGGTPVANTWNHFCGTWDGSTLTVYLNAGSANSASTSTLTAPAASLVLGAERPNTSPLNGLISEVMIHNRVLSQNEIRLLASRRGIAYEMAQRRRSSVQVAAAFNRRRRLLIGASS